MGHHLSDLILKSEKRSRVKTHDRSACTRGSPPEAYPTALLQSFEGYPLCIHPRPGQTVSARRSVCLSAERRYDTQAWLSAQADKMENTVLSQHTRPSEVPRLPLRRGRHRAGLPGNVEIITGSALTPLWESVTALPSYPSKAGREIQPTCP